MKDGRKKNILLVTFIFTIFGLLITSYFKKLFIGALIGLMLGMAGGPLGMLIGEIVGMITQWALK